MATDQPFLIISLTFRLLTKHPFPLLLPPLFLHGNPNNSKNRACRPFGAKTALSAEWEKEWKELDFEGDLAKIQKDAEERLEEKVQELMSNIESTGTK